MIPPFVKRIGVVTALVSAVVSAYMLLANWRAGAAFAVASLWSIANLLVWTAIIVVAFSNDSGKRMKLALMITGKILVLYVGGFLLLRAAAPLTPAQALGILGGISSVFIVAGLKAAGAWLTGRDVFDASVKSSHAHSGAGGQP
jgi:hypothetical protein